MSLKSSTKQDKPNLYSLEITVSAEDFQKALNKAFGKVKNRISIPGFRKGKITRKMAETFYGKEFLYEDALEICYPETVEAAITESGLDFVGTGKADVKKMSEAEGVEIELEVYVKPEIEVSAYKELKATKQKVEVTDEEVENKIKELVERNVRIVPVEDRAAADGDITVIDFEGFVDGKAFDGGKAESYELTLGSGSFIPGFEDQIVGHNAGEEFDVNVTFPEDYQPNLAGKAAVFKIKLHEIKSKQYPEVNDEFAQDAADCDTVDALKKSLSDEIKEKKNNDNESEIEQQLLDKLAENVVGDIPEVMYENEVDNQLRDIQYRLSSQGMDFNMYLQYTGMSIEDYKEQLKPSAEKNVKVRLALEKIIELESLEVSDEEVDEEYEKVAKQYGMEKDDVKKAVAEDTVKGDLKMRKAVKFVRDNAKVTTARKSKVAKEKAEDKAEASEESAE